MIKRTSCELPKINVGERRLLLMNPAHRLIERPSPFGYPFQSLDRDAVMAIVNRDALALSGRAHRYHTIDP
jgi:hypothetical protein